MVNKFLITIWIIIFVGAVIHFNNGITAWKLAKRKSILAVFMSLTSYCLFLAFFILLFNFIAYPRKDPLPTISLVLSTIAWSLFAISGMLKYMALANGKNPGMIKKALIKLFKKLGALE
jgi:hypothetical protein